MNRILLLILIATIIYTVFVFQRNLSMQKNTYTSYAKQLVNNSTLLHTLEPDIIKEVTGIVDVTANNNRFNPDTISILHLKSKILRISAQDRDYTFILKEFNIQEVIHKGESKEIKVSGLGVGTYTVECDLGCTATISVSEIEDSVN